MKVTHVLTADEVSHIPELLGGVEENYPNFADWVSRTVSEIGEGKKKAFGAWWNGELAGVAILKPTVSGTAEMKNFYVHPEYRREGVASQLYDFMEQECLGKYALIETDVPGNSAEMISFLLKRGWELGSAGYPKYGKGTRAVILYKELPLRFSGNVYDWEEMARWTTEKVWGFRITDNHPVIEGKAFDGEGLREEKGLSMKILLEVKQTEAAVDVDAITTLSEIGRRNNYNVLAFFAPSFTGRAVRYAGSRNVQLVDRERLGELAGVNPPEPTSGEPAGIIVPVKGNLFNRFGERPNRLAYIRGGNKPNKVGEGNKVLFYVAGHPQKISGVGSIVDFVEGEPNSVWRRIKTYSVFGEDEYRRFVEGKRKVWAVIFDNFEEVDGSSAEEIRRIFPSWNPQAVWYVGECQMGTLLKHAK